MRVRALLAVALLALFPPLGAAAQDALSMGQVQSPVLTIDSDRLLAETLLGQRFSEELRQRTEALAAENETLRVELIQEERSLTERRPTMEAEDFRAEAEAFDARVQRIRSEQDAKQRALEQAVIDSRETFLNAATPVLARLMIDSGAAVILERRNVFLSAGLVDVTDEAVAAIDAQLGDGRDPPRPPREGTQPSDAAEPQESDSAGGTADTDGRAPPAETPAAETPSIQPESAPGAPAADGG